MGVCHAKNTSSPRFTTGKSAHAYIVARVCDYLDATGKTHVSQSQDSIFFSKERREQLEQAGRVTPKDQLPQTKIVWPSWVPKGKVYVGGYLAGVLGAKGFPATSPVDDVAQREWANALADEWVHQLARGSDVRSTRAGPRTQRADRKPGEQLAGRIIAKCFAVTLEVKRTAEISAMGLPAPLILNRAIEEMLRKYCEKQGWRGDRMGYVYAYHFDKNHVHIHVYILPRTEQGHLFRCSNGARTRDGHRVNQLTDLSEIASSQVERLVAEMSRPPVEMGLRAQILDVLLSRHLAGDATKAIDQGLTKQIKEIEQVALLAAEGYARTAATPPPVADIVTVFRRMVDPDDTASLDLGSDDNRHKKERLRRRLMRLMMGLEHEKISRTGFSKRNVDAMGDIRNALLSRQSMPVENVMKFMTNTIQAGDLQMKPSQQDEAFPWTRNFADYLNQRMDNGRGVVLRQLGGELFAAKAKTDKALSSYLGDDFLGLNLLTPDRPFTSFEAVSEIRTTRAPKEIEKRPVEPDLIPLHP